LVAREDHIMAERVTVIEQGMRLSAAQGAALERAGFAVRRVADVAAALAQDAPPHLALVCVRGTAQVAALAQAGGPTRVVVLAQRPTVRGATAAVRAGASDYLAASVGGPRLVAALRQVLASAPLSTAPPNAADDLISLVSHELRSPLMTINGYLELLQKHHGKLPEAKAQDFIARSLAATGELAYLSDMLMQALHCEVGTFAATRRAVALAPLAAEAIAQCAPHATAHRILCEIPPAIQVWADPVAIQQVIRNLVSNAIKYAPQGGTVTLSASTLAGDVTLAVRDEGIGMTPAQMTQLFQRFARVHDVAQWPAIRGTGLGLYVCRQILAAHAGAIWAASTPGQGSTFFVRLPLAPPPSLAPMLAAPEQAPLPTNAERGRSKSHLHTTVQPAAIGVPHGASTIL
jgi:signal transduction histidine kinase